jgi:hypothetical protein
MVGDGIWHLLRVVETTGWLYWVLSIVIGVSLLAWATLRRLDRLQHRVLAVVLSAIGTGVYAALFTSLL